jgi:hypothetical protein
LQGGGGTFALDTVTSAALYSRVLGICLFRNYTFKENHNNSDLGHTYFNYGAYYVPRGDIPDTKNLTIIPLTNQSCPALPASYDWTTSNNQTDGSSSSYPHGWIHLLDAPYGENGTDLHGGTSEDLDGIRFASYVNILSGTNTTENETSAATQYMLNGVCPAIMLRPGPLENATNYHTMRYKCSNDTGVLCDYGKWGHRLSEPVAVSPSGDYLTEKTLGMYPDVQLGEKSTTQTVLSGVICMLILAVLSNAFSILYIILSKDVIEIAKVQGLDMRNTI